MGNYKDIKGIKFGRWTAIERVCEGEIALKSKHAIWSCVCDCGEIRSVRLNSLTTGKSQSCGCLKIERIIEGRKKTKFNTPSRKRLQSIWNGMKSRCYDEKNREYKNYGAKGVIVCDKWLTFEGFKDDMYELYLKFEEENGEKSATIDRINSMGNYEPSNCRWQTQLQQARNRSNNISVIVDGVSYGTISQLAEAYGLNYQTVMNRYKKGKRDLELVTKHNLKNPNSEMIRGTNGLYSK